MFKRWKPLGEELGTYPGLELQTHGLSVSVVWSEWLGGQCLFRMRVDFGKSMVSLMVWDESPIDFGPGLLPDDAFDSGETGHYSAWVERQSDVLESYGEYARMLYKRIDRYHFAGQEVEVLLDIADAEPTVTIEVPRMPRLEP